MLCTESNNSFLKSFYLSDFAKAHMSFENFTNAMSFNNITISMIMTNVLP